MDINQTFDQTYHRNIRFFLVSITSFSLQDNSFKLKSSNHGVGFEIDVVLICGDKLDDMIRWNEVVLSTQRNQNIHNWFTASANTHTHIAKIKHDQTVIPMKRLIRMYLSPLFCPFLSPAMHCGCGLLSSWEQNSQRDVPVYEIFWGIHGCVL